MKENAGAQRKGGYAAALRAKQAAAAVDDAAAAAPLPRVAVLTSHSRLASHPIRSPLLSSLSDRPLSSHKARPAKSQQTAATQRVGYRPATHSQRLVPLADATARAPAGTAASRATRQHSVSSSVVIGDPGLDAAEQALQAELAATDRQLEHLLRQSQQRRLPTPEPAPPAATRAAVAPGVVLGVPADLLSPASVLQPAGRQSSLEPQAVAAGPAVASEPHQEQQQEQAHEPAIPPQDQSIVRSVVTATGTGCKDIIALHTGAVLPPGACWTSRGHRTLRLESSAILQLWGRTNADVTLRITFADAASVPRIVRLEHAPTPTAAFERLGDIRLQAKSLTQLKHLFRLGKSLEVQRCLRITLLGHMAEEDSGAHRVTHMLLTSSLGPQRSGSALSQATFAAPDPLSARSAQASVNHAPGQQPHLDFITPRDQATPDSGAALPPPLSAHSAAPAPPAATQAAEAPAPEPRPQSSSSSQPRVPLLPLASILSGGSSASASHGPAQSAQLPSQPAAAAEEGVSAQRAHSAAAESGGAPVAECSTGIPAQQAQSIRAELDFLLLAEEFAAATQVQEEAAHEKQGQPEEEEQPIEAPAEADSETAAPASHSADRLRASAAAPMMLLPAQRCSDVAATLSKLQLTPEQAKRAVLQLLDMCSSAADEHADDLLACLPSHAERAVLAGYDGAPDALSSAEQFMLEVMALPALDARVEAWHFAARFASRANALGATAALLAGACAEVQQSELLRTLLKVALLAGGFLNAGNKDGGASGFQVDALLRLKDVRSTRARSRTLLHFVAREVARQHPDGASLAAELPSTAAAAQVDLGAAVAELEGLAVEAREAQAVLAAGGSSCTAPLTAFQAAVTEQLAALQAQLDEAQAAFKQLGTIINGQRATLAEPAVFFGILHTFADELDAAHRENAEADAVADAASSARKSRRTGAGGSPTASAVSEASRRSSRRSHTPDNVRGSVASVGQASSLQRLKQVAVEQRRSTASAAPAASAASQQPRHAQHSPQPCLSQAAVASLGGSRRSSMAAGSPPPASSAVAVASLLGSGGNKPTPQEHEAPPEQQVQQQAQQAGSKLSTPVEELLKESARIISSIDLGDRDGGGGGFGSAIIASEAAAASSGAVGDTAGTPDGAVVSVAVESDAGFTTPRHALGSSQPSGPAAAGVLGAVPLRYVAGGSTADEVPGAARAAAGAQLGGDRPAGATSNSALNMSQMRQRSLQHLSPTSTPLSSLGRQSSRSSVVSSDAGGSTPASGKHARGSVLRHSASPLGAAQQVQHAGHTAAAGAEAGAGEGRGAAASHALCFPDLPAGRAASPAPDAAARAEQQAQLRASYQPGQAADMYAYSSDEEESPTDAARRAAVAEAEAAEVLAAARPPTGFGALHSRASSCDLTFYAPFTLHQMGQSEEMEQQGLGGSFEAIVSAGSGSAWAPLAATQQRRLSASTGGLRHVATVDAATLQRDAAAAAASMQAAPRRVAVSMPASPRGGARARPPQPLNLGRVAGRLQLHQRALERQSQPQQLSPVLEALLDSVPTPYAAPAASVSLQRAPQEEPAATPAAPAAELTADDLVDLGNFTSDHEAEWAALEEIEAADLEHQRQQAAERERRELAMLQALLPPAAPHAAPREPTPEWIGDRQQMQEWLAAQQAAVDASTEYLQQAQQGEGYEEEDDEQQQLEHAALMVQVPGEEQAGADAGGALAALPYQQLPPLPSPITTATVNLDATLARLLASAGNTPSGPLAKQAGRWVAAADGDAAAEQDGPQLGEEGEAVFLLEPVLPAPLGEGIRASERMAEGIPPAALRSSIECLKASVRPGSAASLRRSGSAPPTSLSQEAAAWAAQQAQQAGVQRQGSLDPAAAAAYGAEWDGGVGPARRRDHLRGLRKLLSRGRQQ